MAYARHQSFYIKQNWINKGIKAVDANPSLFMDVSNYKELGIGKNMFISLKYWLEALNIVDFSKDTPELTPFGRFISEFDLSCQKPFTLNLLHYYLTLKEPMNGADLSHTFYWFFNLNEDRIFKKATLLDELVKWDTSEYKRSTSENTIGRDIDCLLLTYTKTEKSHPEDKNVSVLANLKLLQKQGDSYVRLPLRSSMLDKKVFFYMTLNLIEKENQNKFASDKFLEIGKLIDSEMSPGRIFGMNRVDIIDVLEEMISEGYPLEVVRTNDIDTMIVRTTDTAEEYLSDIFRFQGKEK